MDGNYVKLSRGLLEWEWYSDINTSRMFIHMLLKANWKDGNFKGVIVPRGSFISSIGKLIDETGLTEREVRTSIAHLKKTGEVTSRTTNRYTVFTVVKYDIYQTTDKQSDKQTSDKRQANDNLTTYKRQSNDKLTSTIEEGKNIKNERREEGNLENCKKEIQACEVAIKTLEEVQQYHAIGTPEECRAAVEKQTAKKPCIQQEERGYCFECPSCDSFIGYEVDCKDEHYRENYCPNCGQKLDWSEDE